MRVHHTRVHVPITRYTDEPNFEYTDRMEVIFLMALNNMRVMYIYIFLLLTFKITSDGMKRVGGKKRTRPRHDGNRSAESNKFRLIQYENTYTSNSILTRPKIYTIDITLHTYP